MNEQLTRQERLPALAAALANAPSQRRLALLAELAEVYGVDPATIWRALQPEIQTAA